MPAAPPLALLTTLLYLAAATLLARAFAQRLPLPRGPVHVLMGLGLVIHAHLWARLMEQAGGLSLALFPLTVLHAGLLAGLAWLMSLWRRLEGLLLVAAPLAALELALGLAGASRPGPLLAAHHDLLVHVTLSVLAYSVLSIAALQALVLHRQTIALKQHRPRFSAALPPLQTMESLLFQLIGLGWLLLTAAMITGSWVLNDLLAQSVAHKTLFTVLSWLIFSVLLLGRWRAGWRGRTAIRATWVGFAVLLVGFIGSKWVLEVVLARA